MASYGSDVWQYISALDVLMQVDKIVEHSSRLDELIGGDLIRYKTRGRE
jgi:hypothetical protein